MRKLLVAGLMFGSLLSSCSPEKKAEQAEEQILNVAGGRIERLENFDSKYITPRNVDVWLPDNYSDSKKYAVLYMHDGQMLFDSTTTWNKQEWKVDEVVSDLLKKGTIKDCIVVGVWNIQAERHSDYFPQKPFEALGQTVKDSLISKAKRSENTHLFSTTVNSDNYLKFLVKELKPYIDSHYSVKTDMENTVVAGSSMGGLISMYAICEYPQVFSGAACISTHWPGIMPSADNPVPAKFMEYLDANLPDPTNHKIYFDYGTATLDQYYEPYQLEADKIMEKHGFNSSNWETRKFEGENHSENAWNKRLHIPVTFLLNK
ncbi:alpha/beta hydrolase [Sediminitomix flava]|nr:alpha/beta hydrolase-fold protein [Sediminitomix flava]